MHVTLVGPEFEENLSLRYLAAALERAGHTAGMARFDSAEHTEAVVAQILRERPALVGLSMVFQVRAREFCSLAEALRAAGYRGHITAGGHFATFACEDLLRDYPAIDSIVRQEGEETLVEMATTLSAGEGACGLPGIPGVATRGAGGEIVVAGPRVQTTRLDDLPFPIRSAEPEYHLGIPTAYLVGSRGCYADCEYCCIFAWHEAAVGKRYRMRSVENIAEEMEQLYRDRGIRFFVFHDDNFFLPTAAGNRKRIGALRAELERRNLTDIALMLKLRPNDCDLENLRTLREMGLLRAFVGIENASPRQMRSLGRDTTIEDVHACLNLLRDLDVYCTFNILLFDPYTTLDDIEINLKFLRAHTWYPFNWCKVEPYAGTELQKRYAREERLRGDYFGHDYRMDDPRVRLLYDILLPAFAFRNYDYYGLANLNIGLGYHLQLLKRFYPEWCEPELTDRAHRLIEEINQNAIDLLERACTFVRTIDLHDETAIAEFAAALKSDSFQAQRTLGAKIEVMLCEVERAAGVRQDRVGVSPNAFVPLTIVTPGEQPRHRPGIRFRRKPAAGGGSSERPPALPAAVSPRRSLLAALGGMALWLLAGCPRPRSSPPAQTPAPGVPPTTPAGVTGSMPRGIIDVAEGYPDTVLAGETLTLDAVLTPHNVVVLGTPRIVANGGIVKSVTPRDANHSLRIVYLPQSESNFDPNENLTVAWTVSTRDGDMVISARADVHYNADGSFGMGITTPRPTIAEMAAPPIRHGPSIPPGMFGGSEGSKHG